jgi:hypothetical protein
VKQVLPLTHSFFWPHCITVIDGSLQFSVQPCTSQLHFAEESLQFTVHPPSGHETEQVVVPSQLRVEDALKVTVQSLPPPHVTVELAPVVTVHPLVPSQVTVELLPVVRLQLLLAVHDVVQPDEQEPVQVVPWAH